MERFDTYGGRQTAFDHRLAESAVAEFFWKTYRWMSVGLAVTALVAAWAATSGAVRQIIFGNPYLFYGLLIGELVMVVAFSARAHRVSTGTAAAMFLGFAALNGLTLSVIFLMYQIGSIGMTFGVTAASFAGLSFAGYVTRRDLSGMRGFLVVGLIGVILASVVNIFLHSPAVYWFTTFAGVLVFAGLTAYDTQKLKQLYRVSGEAGNLPLRGALSFYLDFVNLFLFLLRIFGRRR